MYLRNKMIVITTDCCHLLFVLIEFTPLHNFNGFTKMPDCENVENT